MIAVHPRVCIDQVSFPSASVEEFIAHCRTMGASNVVLYSAQLLTEAGLAAAKQAVGSGELNVEAVSHIFGAFPDLEADRGGATETLTRVISISAELGARSVYLLTGGRGQLRWEQAAARFSDLVAPGVAMAQQNEMRLLIENASGFYAELHIAHTLADTVALAERAGIGVCIELQFCWPEGGLAGLFRRAMPRCGLVQVSDYVLGDRSLPARAVPGDGVIPLQGLVGDILEAGYTGLFDIELLGPRIDCEGHLAAATRAAKSMGSILTDLGV